MNENKHRRILQIKLLNQKTEICILGCTKNQLLKWNACVLKEPLA